MNALEYKPTSSMLYLRATHGACGRFTGRFVDVLAAVDNDTARHAEQRYFWRV